MSQHFLLSSKARSLSIINIVKMSDMEAFEMFKSIRWSETNGDVVCPCCGSLEKPYFLKTRMQFRCKECFYTFSVPFATFFKFQTKLLNYYIMLLPLVLGVSLFQIYLRVLKKNLLIKLMPKRSSNNRSRWISKFTFLHNSCFISQSSCFNC